MGVIVFAITRKQEQRASELLLGGIEEVIDQILFDSDVSRKHAGNEEVGEFDGRCLQIPIVVSK
jgi:hypothetical protein